MRWMSRTSRVPLHRRWITDILNSGGTGHIVGVDMVMNVAAAQAARTARRPAISWVSIWVRAVALASVKWPELRTAYLPFPWPRLYLHPLSAATVLLERKWHGARAVFFDTIRGAEQLRVGDIDLWYAWLRRERIESIGSFRRIIRVAKLPLPVRRMLWNASVQWSGWLRWKYIGNFAVSSVAPTRFSVVQVAVPASFTVFFGRVNPDGTMKVQFFADHRLVDGLVGDRIVRDIERIMNTEIVAELAAD